MIALVIIGFCIIILGFIYDVKFAGIPYQDPTAELQERYAFHSAIAGYIRWVGAAIFIGPLLFDYFSKLNKE